MVSALWMSLGTGDTQGVTLAKQCHQCPAGVSGPGRRSSPRGCALLCPVWGCTCGVVYPWPLPPLPGRVCRAAGSCGMADGAENGHTQSAHPALGGFGVGGVTTMLHGAPPAWTSAMGQCHHLCVLRGVGDTGGTPQLSPALAPSCSVPVPRGKRSWWYFCCLARIRSILEVQDAAEPAPPDPQGHPIHRGAPKCRERGPSAPQNPLTAASAGPATSSRIAGASAGSS